MTDDREVIVPVPPDQQAASANWVSPIHTTGPNIDLPDLVRRTFSGLLAEAEARGYRKAVERMTRAGMWHLVMEAVDAAGVPWAEVSPAGVKRYATGKGNAQKDAVLAAVIRRFPAVEVTGNDEADALVLAAMGADHRGEPMVEMPKEHRTALVAVRWPVKGHEKTARHSPMWRVPGRFRAG